MPLEPSPASIPSHLTAAPLMLPWNLRLTPEQFERVCKANPEAVLELAADGQLISVIPTGGETGARCLRLGQRLLLWADGPGTGAWIAFDSSTGFRLADGSVLSPDGSLMRLKRWQALTPAQRRGFPPLCPDLVMDSPAPAVRAPAVRAPATKAPEASPPCAIKWTSIKPTAPASAGCCFPTNGPLRSGGAASGAGPNGWRTPAGSMAASWQRGWR